MNALQDVHAQGTNLRFNGLLNIAWILDFFHQDCRQTFKKKVGTSGAEGLNTDHLSSN